MRRSEPEYTKPLSVSTNSWKVTSPTGIGFVYHVFPFFHEVGRPFVDGLDGKYGLHLADTSCLLLVWHLQRRKNGIRNLVRIIGIYLNGIGQFHGSTRHLTQYQYPRIVDFVATYSLATRFIPSRNGVTKATSATKYMAVSSSNEKP